jgi:hypothetical protein
MKSESLTCMAFHLESHVSADRLKRTHDPQIAGSNPAPATKKTLGIPTCAEGFLASQIPGCPRVKPVST